MSIPDIDTECEQQAFETFAQLYPVEAQAQDPDRFWKYFHAQFPDLTRDLMLELLSDGGGAGLSAP